MDLLLNPGSRQEQMLEQEKHFKGVGSIKKRKGLSLWALDKTNGTVSRCELEVRKTAVMLADGRKILMSLGQHKLVIKPNNEYLQAMNHKNAVRKFKNLQRRGIIQCEGEIQ